MNYLKKRVLFFKNLKIPGESIVDYGGGDGKFLEYLSIKDKYLIDINKRSFTTNIKFYYPSTLTKQVDIVFINMALHHIENLELALEEIKQLMHKDSTLVIREFDANQNTISLHKLLDEKYQKEKKLNNYTNYQSQIEWERKLAIFFKPSTIYFEDDNMYGAYWQIFYPKHFL